MPLPRSRSPAAAAIGLFSATPYMRCAMRSFSQAMSSKRSGTARAYTQGASGGVAVAVASSVNTARFSPAAKSYENTRSS